MGMTNREIAAETFAKLTPGAKLVLSDRSPWAKHVPAESRRVMVVERLTEKSVWIEGASVSPIQARSLFHYDIVN